MRGPPLQTRVVAAYGTVLQLANMLVISNNDPGAHGMNRGKAKQTGWGQTVVKGSVHGMAKASRHTACRTNHCRRTWPADSPPGTGLKKQTASRWPASQRNNSCQMTLVGLSPCSAGRWGECSGAGSQEGGCRPTYCPYPTYRLCWQKIWSNSVSSVYFHRHCS